MDIYGIILYDIYLHKLQTKIRDWNNLFYNLSQTIMCAYKKYYNIYNIYV